MREAAASVIVTAWGRQWQGSWRDDCARHWRVVEGRSAGHVLKEIRRTNARIVVVVFLPDARNLDVLRLLCGPPHRICVVAVATVHSDGFEREVRACGVACYIPLTRDFGPVLRAVEELMDQVGGPAIAARVHPLERVARNSSFPPPLTNRGRRALLPAAPRERGGRKQNP